MKKLTSKEKAENAILYRLKIMNDFAIDGIPFQKDKDGKYLTDEEGNKKLEYVPDSLTALCSWELEDLSPYLQEQYEVFGKVTRQTLNNKRNTEKGYPREAQDKIDLLLVQAELKDENNISSIKDEVDRLKKEVFFWENIAKSEAQVVTSVRGELQDIEEKYIHEIAALKRNVDELNRNLDVEKEAYNKLVDSMKDGNVVPFIGNKE